MTAPTAVLRMLGGRVSLRLADWRFLLPHPPGGCFQHLVLLGAPPGLAERLVETGLARRVSESVPTERSADAVVALHRSRAALPEIAGCLRAKGVIYLEVDRRVHKYLFSTPARLRRALRDAGLSPSAMYAVVPKFLDHRIYLPLDVPGALRWYVTTLRSALTPWQHIVQAGMWAATGLNGRRFAGFAPRLAVTAVAGGGPTASASVLAHPTLPADLRDRDFRPLLLTGGGDRVVMMPFAPGGTAPAAVLKVPRLPGFNGRSRNEQATLHRLRTQLNPESRSSIPKPLGLLQHGDLTVAIESYVPGELLARSGEQWAVPLRKKLSDLRLAAQWLTDFHLQTEVVRSSWGPEQRSEWLQRPCASYQRAFGLTAREARLFAKAREYAAALPGAPFPLVLQHRDYTVWNITRAGGALGVLDWEGSRPGPPLCDMLHFVAHWYETVHRAHTESARQHCFRRLLFEPEHPDPLRGVVREEITRYMDRLQLHQAFLPVLLLYTWIELALRRLDQQRIQGESAASVRMGNRSLPFVAILAEYADRLFAADGPGEQRRWL